MRLLRLPSKRPDCLILAAAWLLLAVMALGPFVDRHEAKDLGRSHERSTPVALNAVHGAQAAHLDAAGEWAERQCFACLFQGRNQALSWRPLPALERPPAYGALTGAADHALPGPVLRSDRSRAPPRLA